MNKLRYAIIGGVLGLLLFSLGCVSPGDAERIAGKLFEAISGQDFEAATSYYSTEFFQMTPKDSWIKELTNINVKYGDLQSWKLISWHVTEIKGTGGDSTKFELVYETIYMTGSSRESLSLIKLGGESPTVVGHKIEFHLVPQAASPGTIRYPTGM